MRLNLGFLNFLPVILSVTSGCGAEDTSCQVTADGKAVVCPNGVFAPGTPPKEAAIEERWDCEMTGPIVYTEKTAGDLATSYGIATAYRLSFGWLLSCQSRNFVQQDGEVDPIWASDQQMYSLHQSVLDCFPGPAQLIFDTTKKQIEHKLWSLEGDSPTAKGACSLVAP